MFAPRVILSEAVMRCNRSVTGLPRIFDSSVEGDSVEDGSCWNATLCLALTNGPGLIWVISLCKRGTEKCRYWWETVPTIGEGKRD